MSIIVDLFEKGFDLYKNLTVKAKNNTIIKKQLIREIRDNLKLLEHRNRKGIDRKALIDKLSNSSIISAITENYQFNYLARKQRITPAVASQLPKTKKYLNWDAEHFISSIDEKISSLKNLPDLFPDFAKAPVNLTLRLNNLYFQLILLSYLIRQSEK